MSKIKQVSGYNVKLQPFRGMGKLTGSKLDSSTSSINYHD